MEFDLGGGTIGAWAVEVLGLKQQRPPKIARYEANLIFFLKWRGMVEDQSSGTSHPISVVRTHFFSNMTKFHFFFAKKCIFFFAKNQLFGEKFFSPEASHSHFVGIFSKRLFFIILSKLKKKIDPSSLKGKTIFQQFFLFVCCHQLSINPKIHQKAKCEIERSTIAVGKSYIMRTLPTCLSPIDSNFIAIIYTTNKRHRKKEINKIKF